MATDSKFEVFFPFSAEIINWSVKDTPEEAFWDVFDDYFPDTSHDHLRIERKESSLPSWCFWVKNIESGETIYFRLFNLREQIEIKSQFSYAVPIQEEVID